DREVKGQDQQLERTEAMNQLIDFQRDKSSRGNDCQNFRPAFAEVQSDTFRKVQRGIHKGAQADLSQLVLVDKRELVEQQVHVVVMWIDSKEVTPVLHFVGFPSGQDLYGDSDAEQRESLKKFEYGDHHQSARMRLTFSSMRGHVVSADCNASARRQSLL